MRWGEKLEFVAEAGPGDFIFVPPYVPHQEINAESDVALECVSQTSVSFMLLSVGLSAFQVLMRSDGDSIAVNLPDLDPVETPEGVKWIDPTHANLPDHPHHHDHSHPHDHSHDHSHT